MSKRAKSKSIFEQMAVLGAKPDAWGFIPIDPMIWEAVKRHLPRN